MKKARRIISFVMALGMASTMMGISTFAEETSEVTTNGFVYQEEYTYPDGLSSKALDKYNIILTQRMLFDGMSVEEINNYYDNVVTQPSLTENVIDEKYKELYEEYQEKLNNSTNEEEVRNILNEYMGQMENVNLWNPALKTIAYLRFGINIDTYVVDQTTHPDILDFLKENNLTDDRLYPWLDFDLYYNCLAGTITNAEDYFHYDDGSLMNTYNELYYVNFGDQVWITGYNNEALNTDTIVVPSEIDGVPVTRIAKDAFESSYVLKNVNLIVIPVSVKLDDRAFSNLSYISALQIDGLYDENKSISNLDVMVIDDTNQYTNYLDEMQELRNDRTQNGTINPNNVCVLGILNQEHYNNKEYVQSLKNDIVWVNDYDYLAYDIIPMENDFTLGNVSIADVNNDGNSASNDLLLLKKVLLGTYQEDTSTLNTDINQDGKANSADLLCLKKIILGLL